MVLAGVIEEFVRHAALLVGELLGELRPQAQGLANWHGVILVAVDDQHGRADIPHEAVRRMVLQHLRADFLPPVVVGVGGRTELAQGPEAGMADDGPEAVGVPGDPVGHVAAERAAHGSAALAVDVVAGLRGVADRQQVLIGVVSENGK